MKPEKTELLGRSLPEVDNSEQYLNEYRQLAVQTSHHDIDYAGDDVK